MFAAAGAAVRRATLRLNERFAGPVMSQPAAARRTLADGAKEVEEKYAQSLSIMHWLIATGFIGCAGAVQIAQRTEDKELKGKIMNIHKSLGVLMVGLVVPRIALRLATKIPKPLPAAPWQHMAASAGHIGLYGIMLFMPASGIAMGYFGGKGLPFFGAHIAGAESPNGAIAKQAFKTHRLVGQFFEYALLPGHILGAGMHVVKGQKIFARISPFR